MYAHFGALLSESLGDTEVGCNQSAGLALSRHSVQTQGHKWNRQTDAVLPLKIRTALGMQGLQRPCLQDKLFVQSPETPAQMDGNWPNSLGRLELLMTLTMPH